MAFISRFKLWPNESLSAYIVQTAAGTVTASKYTIKKSHYNTISNSMICRKLNIYEAFLRTYFSYKENKLTYLGTL